LTSNGAPATEVIFAFADQREDSQISIPAAGWPEGTRPPTSSEAQTIPAGMGPKFTQNFEYCYGFGALPYSGSDTADMGLWIRHIAPEARVGELSLMCIADAMPPALVTRMKGPAPLSSMSWQANFLTDAPTTDDGWWLLRARAHNLAGGFSSQEMTIWNTAGDCVVSGFQLVTVFA
tara:strand:+ start:99 stop:629 length:531 start_codon:yes stop_codon:yes gene_type:complete